MRLRYTLVLCAIGLFLAWETQSVFLAYFSVIGASAMFSLRRIDDQIGDMKGRIGSQSEKAPAFDHLWYEAFKPTEPMRTPLKPMFFGSGWKPVMTFPPFESTFRPDPTYPPLRMRKRDEEGKWIYRDPTEDEIQEYISNEGW